MKIIISDSTAIQLIETMKDLTGTLQNLTFGTKEPKFLFAKDVSKILKVNTNVATELLKREDIPSIKDCGRLKVEEQAFLEWCRQNKKRID